MRVCAIGGPRPAKAVEHRHAVRDRSGMLPPPNMLRVGEAVDEVDQQEAELVRSHRGTGRSPGCRRRKGRRSCGLFLGHLAVAHHGLAVHPHGAAAHRNVDVAGRRAAAACLVVGAGFAALTAATLALTSPAISSSRPAPTTREAAAGSAPATSTFRCGTARCSSTAWPWCATARFPRKRPHERGPFRLRQAGLRPASGVKGRVRPASGGLRQRLRRSAAVRRRQHPGRHREQRPVLHRFRAGGPPIAHTRIVFADDGADANIFTLKVPGLLTLTEASPASAIVSALAPVAGELVLRKTQPSGFWAPASPPGSRHRPCRPSSWSVAPQAAASGQASSTRCHQAFARSCSRIASATGRSARMRPTCSTLRRNTATSERRLI